MNQTDIAEKLIKHDKKGEGKGISQAQISKWRRGIDGIPFYRQIELLKIADLYWKIGNQVKLGKEPWDAPIETEVEIVDSRWNILVQSEKNQEDWYDYISDILSPRRLMNEDGLSSDFYFSHIVRTCLVMLNEAGFIGIPENPSSISNDSYYFELLYRWIYRITILQKWFHNQILTNINIDYDDEINKLYISLPRIALANELILGTPTLPKEINMLSLSSHLDETKNLVRASVERILGYTIGEYTPIFHEESFEVILEILTKQDEPMFHNPNSSQKPELQSQDSQDISHWSEAERKIYEGIKQNEKLLKELLEKLDK